MINLLNDTRPPAIVLGGEHNALSIARNLGRAGVQVYAINTSDALIRYSRFCSFIDVPGSTQLGHEAWTAFLLGRESDFLKGAVLLAADDDSIKFIAEHRELLSTKFLLDLSNPVAQLCMLDKLGTYLTARATGVPVPRFWLADTREQLENLEYELVFPLILKPLLGHEYRRKFGCIFAVASCFEELLGYFDRVHREGIRTFLVEMIPGADSNLCSYYTYLDENGNNLFDFTKRVLRKYPIYMGTSSYHITEHIPDVRELALALFRQVGLRGLANAEFKFDARDGRLKLIECNARFTAADCLLVESGLDLPLFVYNRITGDSQPIQENYRMGLRLWKPVTDLLAFRQLHRLGLLSFWSWIRSILHPQVFPVFKWNDPLPGFIGISRIIQSTLSGVLRHFGKKISSIAVHEPEQNKPTVATIQQIRR
jgi:D-aspartate ligase